MLQQSYNLQENACFMKARIIAIGNSKGLIIPATMLKQLALEEDVEIEVEDGALIVRPKKVARVGWEDQIKRAVKQGDNDKSLPDFFADETLEDWTW